MSQPCVFSGLDDFHSDVHSEHDAGVAGTFSYDMWGHDSELSAADVPAASMGHPAMFEYPPLSPTSPMAPAHDYFGCEPVPASPLKAQRNFFNLQLATPVRKGAVAPFAAETGLITPVSAGGSPIAASALASSAGAAAAAAAHAATTPGKPANPFYCLPSCMRSASVPSLPTLSFAGDEFAAPATAHPHHLHDPFFSHPHGAAAPGADSLNFFVPEVGFDEPIEDSESESGDSLMEHAHSLSSASSLASFELPARGKAALDAEEALSPAAEAALSPAVVAAPVVPAPRGRRAARTDAAKPFECPDCQKAFRRMEHLRRHAKMHTNERPFACDIDGCGRRFSRNDNLKAHRKTHAKRTGRNIYVEGIELPVAKKRKSVR